tara:strand:- start:165 stop:887 length:723 start_codon:yes stop_codon:yes gene_type:complete
MEGDYVSLASTEPAEVIVIDETNSLVQKVTMTRSASADPLAPYAMTYNPRQTFAAGYRFVCSAPCLAIFEPKLNDDETLMTGITKSSFKALSTNATPEASLPELFEGNGGDCSGSNNFPNISWNDVPWGTKSLTIIFEKIDGGGHVHLNLVDVDHGSGSLGPIDGVNGVVNFPSGIAGTNDYSNIGWTGPCNDGAIQTYRFKIYAMATTFGNAINNTSSASFEASYGNNILESFELTLQF